MAELSNPHDRYFRETLANPQAARDFLRYYLPAEVAALLDPTETPELMKDLFVDPELRTYFVSRCQIERCSRRGANFYDDSHISLQGYWQPAAAPGWR